MKSRIKYVAAGLSVLGMLAVSGVATATNGYFTHGVGSESKGMAGSGIGSDAAHGAIIAASNPALAVFAEDNWEIGLSAFSPMRDYETTQSLAQGQGGAFSLGAGKVESGSEWFPVPYLAKNWRWGDDKTISFLFRNFSAEVVMYQTPELEIVPNMRDRSLYLSMPKLVEDVRRFGYYGGIRLLKATIKTFYDYCRENNIKLPVLTVWAEAIYTLRNYLKSIPLARWVS